MKQKEKAAKPEGLLEQFDRLKKNHPDTLLMFRNRDFYELYRQDAVKAAALLGLSLGNRIAEDMEKGVAHKVKVAVFPLYDLDTYLPKLIRSGHRVAICDTTDRPELTRKVREGPQAAQVSDQKRPELNVQTNNPNHIDTDMPRKKKEQAPQEAPSVKAKAAASEKPAQENKTQQQAAVKADAKTGAKKDETKQETQALAGLKSETPGPKQGQKDQSKQERKPREPQMVTANGGKVTHGHAFQSKTNPADFYFTAKLDGQQLKPQKMSASDLEAFKARELTVPQLMERYYPTKLMAKVPEAEYKAPKAIDGPEGKLPVSRFNVYKEKDEQRPDFGKYKFYAQVGDAKMSAVASRQDLNAYFDRVATPTQLIEKNFGERLHLKSAYEKYTLPDGVDPKGIRVSKDREDGKWKVSADLGDKGWTGKKELSFDDGYALFKTKTATREQIAAKYLTPEINGLLKAPAVKADKKASLKV